MRLTRLKGKYKWREKKKTLIIGLFSGCFLGNFLI